MKIIVKTVFFLLFAVKLFSQTPAPKVPDFKFYRLDKTVFTSKDLANNKLLFFVFFDSECDHCQHAVKEINKHYKELKKTVLYLITLDGKEKMNPFLDMYGQNLKSYPGVTILRDVNNEFITKFGPRKYPSLFLYSPKKEFILYDDDEKKLPVFFKKIKEYKW